MERNNLYIQPEIPPIKRLNVMRNNWNGYNQDLKDKFTANRAALNLGR